MKLCALIAVIYAALFPSIFFAQAKIVGFAPQFKEQHFYLWKEEDFLSKRKMLVAETLSDAQGLFRFDVPAGPIEKYVLGTEGLNGYLFVQNQGFYRLEFISESAQNSSYNLQEEIELTFIDLDSNDINFKMLGFEAWIDQELSDIHFERSNEGERVRKIALLKLSILRDAAKDTSTYFKDYLRYSVANTLENTNYMGAPTKENLFNTYFFQKAVQYRSPFYTEFFEKYYDQFLSQMDSKDATEIFKAYATLDLRKQDSIISNHPCAGDSVLRSLINLYVLKQAMNNDFLPKSVIESNLRLQSEKSPFTLHRKIANNLLLNIAKLEIGDPFPFERLNYVPSVNKPVYIHAYNPSNTFCIQEIRALRKLLGTYGSNIEFLTLYIEKPLTNEAEKKAMDQITWKKIGLPQNDAFWATIGANTFPYYILVDKEANLLHAPALTPTPNGQYESIEKIFFTLIKP
ncbi:MAG: hypothetical protein FJY06_03160 [Bacteroidetes bacterium]|nr:hypothetical protein [Bacteroidota bacterium]